MTTERQKASCPRIASRIGLIVAVAVAILGFAAYETGAVAKLPGLSRFFAPRGADLNVPALPGSKLLRSYPARFNGRESLFGHYSSRLDASEVIARYKAIASQPGRSLRSALPGAVSSGRGHSMIGYSDSDGSTVGVVAFPAKDGGCMYFVGRTYPARNVTAGRDVPGREPPDVPKPLRSSRVMCVENLAGLPSLLSLYEGWGEIDDTARLIRASLSDAGWRRNEDVEELVGNELPGVLLSYTRGDASCLIHIERERRSGHTATTMFYCEKPWLPDGTGF